MNSPARTSLDSRWWRWLWVWTVVGSPGVCLGLLLWGPATVVWVGTVPAAVVTMVHLMQQSDTRPATGIDVPTLIESTLRVALGAAVATIALGALAATSALVVICLLVVAAATTPPAVDVRRRVWGATKDEPPGPGPETIDRASPLLSTLLAESAQKMSNAELCRAWRRSFLALQDACASTEKEKVVALRQSYLDEMECRNAKALEAWLASGARAAGGPEQFLVGGGDEDEPTAA